MPERDCPFCSTTDDACFHSAPLVRALWDRYPVAPGHALIIPRRHVASWFDATPAERAAMLDATDAVRTIIDQKHSPDGYNLGAENVSVEVRPLAAVTLTAVRHEYPTTRTADGLRLELGDLYAREPKSVLVELFVPALAGAEPEAGDMPLADITVDAHVLTDGGGVERQEVRFPVVTALTSAGHSEPEVQREILLLDAAKAREEALRKRDEGDFGGAAGVLREASIALAYAPAELRAELAEQAGDLEAMASQFAAAEVSEADAKYLAQRAYKAHRGRRSYEEKLSRGRGR